MSFPRRLLYKGRITVGDPHLDYCGFLPWQETVTIGYIVGSGPFDSSVATAQPILPREGQTYSIRVVPDATDNKLHWVQAAQTYGAVAYTWISDGTIYHFLGCADDRPENARDMELAVAAASHRQCALRLHHQTGLNFKMLLRLARMLEYGPAMQAIGLAAWLLEQEGEHLPSVRVRIARLTRMTNPTRKKNLQGHSAADLNGDELVVMIAGAHTVLHNQQE